MNKKREIRYLEIQKNNGNSYKIELPFNEREKQVAIQYVNDGWVVLKNG